MKAGDVWLVTGARTKSELLVSGQKVRYGKAQSSHVLLGLGDGTFIHATGDGGVHLQFFSDELSTIKEGWRVLRKDMSEEQLDAVMTAGLHFLRQGYNKSFFGEEDERASFCSELVAKAYRRAGISIFSGAAPNSIWPADFDREADLGREWKDVTEEYQSRLVEFKENERMYRFGFNTIEQSLRRRHELGKARAIAFDALAMASANPAEAKKRIDSIQDGLKEKRALTFWDED